MPRLYLSNDLSDVGTYKLAYVGTRSPSAAITSIITNTTGSGDNIAATITAGGSAFPGWITKPFLAAATLATKVNVSIWALESNASANASIGINLDLYTAGAAVGSPFLDANSTVELTTSSAGHRFTTAAATSQAIAAGDRLIIMPEAVAVGTMGASQTVTIKFNGATAGADGDSYIDILEDFRVNESQLQSGVSPLFAAGLSTGKLIAMQQELQYAIDRGIATHSTSLRTLLDEIQYELNKLNPRTAVSVPV